MRTPEASKPLLGSYWCGDSALHNLHLSAWTNKLLYDPWPPANHITETHERRRKAPDLVWLFSNLHFPFFLLVLVVVLLFLGTAVFSTGCVLWFNVPVGLCILNPLFVLGKYESNVISGLLGKPNLQHSHVVCHSCCWCPCLPFATVSWQPDMMHDFLCCVVR